MGITGSAVYDGNFRLRFCIIMIMGIMAFGSVMYWRSQLLLSSEYVDIPVARHARKSNTNLYNQYDIDKLNN